MCIALLVQKLCVSLHPEKVYYNDFNINIIYN